jgi:hypothetical protein
MSFFKEIKEVLGWDPDSKTSVEQVNRDNPLFVYIKLPIDLEPEDRMALYADPLEAALAKDGLGAITGGGSMENEEGDGVAFSGVDAELYQVEKGIAVLRSELVRLKAPLGTVLIYELNGQEFEDPVYPN